MAAGYHHDLDMRVSFGPYPILGHQFKCLVARGSLTSVSLVTILIRLKFFRQKFKQLVETDPNARKRIEDMEACKDVREDERTIFQFLHPSNLVFRSTTNNRSEKEQDHEHSPPRSPLTPPPSGTGTPRKGGKKRKLDKLRPDMIRKVDNHSEMQEAINRLAQERQAQEQMAAKDQMPTDISHHSLSQPVDEKKAPDLSYNVEQ